MAQKKITYRYIDCGNYRIRVSIQPMGGQLLVTVEAYYEPDDGGFTVSLPELPSRTIYCVSEAEADGEVNKMRTELAIKQLNEALGHV